MRKGTIWDKISFPNNGQNVKKIYYSSIFSFLVHWKIQIFGYILIYYVYVFASCKLNVAMDAISCSDLYDPNLIQTLIKNAYIFSEKWLVLYVPECLKMVITPLVINIFSWNLLHCIQHTQSFQSILKTQFSWKIPNGPFSHSQSHIIYPFPSLNF